MSAEGKKKRGVAGHSNAQGIPFRYHGGNYQRPVFNRSKEALTSPAKDHGGSTTARGFIGGMLAHKLGYTMHISQRLERKITNALERAPVCDALATEIAKG